MKQVASHLGGTRNPMIVTWPARIKDKSGIRTQFTHLIDVVPTILEAAHPPATKTVAISSNAAITAVPAAIAPIIAGVLLDACVNHGWNKLAVYQWAAAIHHTLILLTVLILVRVKEPRSQPVGELVDAIRRQPELGILIAFTTPTCIIGPTR